MFPSNFKRLAVTCDISSVSLEMALSETKKIPRVTLFVSEYIYTEAVDMLKRLHAIEVDNPFHLYVNIEIDPNLYGRSWYVSCDDAIVGSEGV